MNIDFHKTKHRRVFKKRNNEKKITHTHRMIDRLEDIVNKIFYSSQCLLTT